MGFGLLNALRELLSLLVLAGAVGLVAWVVRPRAPASVPTSALVLVSFGVVGMAGFVLCALAFPRLAPPRVVEELTPHPLLAPLFLGVGLVGIALQARPAAGALRRGVARLRQDPKLLTGVLLSAAVGGAALLWTLLPPFRSDELVYHLALPFQYLLDGGFSPARRDVFSAFPGLVEMLDLWLLALGAESAARGLQVMVLGVGVWALCDLLGPRFWKTALLGSCLFALTPVAFLNLTSAYVDIIQAVFELTAVLAVARFMEEGEPSFLQVGAALAGCAGATKYLGLSVGPFILGMLALAVWRGRASGGRRMRLRAFARATWPAVAFVLPWWLKNVRQFGNPLFPFLNGLFRSPALDAHGQETLKSFLAAYGPLDAQGHPYFGWAALMNLPHGLLFDARFNSLSFDGIIGLLPLVVLGLTLLRRGGAAEPFPPVLTAYAAYRTVIFLLGSWQLRFLLVPWWIGCLFAAYALLGLRTRVARALAGLFTAACVAAQTMATARELPRLDRRMFSTPQARHALRVERNPASALCDQVNLESGAKVMMVWTRQLSYFCLVPQVADAVDEGSVLSSLLEHSEAKEALGYLRAQQISHLLVDEGYWFLMPPNLPADESRTWARVFARYAALRRQGLEEIAREGDRVLYRVRTEELQP